ncbi:ABC transporter ATP-binding subunit [Candidatus Blochmanniella floridana]|uniref:Lipoprotein-releasing system ATP-binding protein LolD n=1 Tax=Blochmanniella floridana TaxID=203907 RepID=LOLD_BLOFL|nr:RecName: Full=Lipoprotein-releasing system ATP-binding protein LolD [Candidatus Blochmannia floridanus]CAD83461.1 ABC transporter ATP-binding subunit [Candidatus Blochmannia floridanus]
MVNKNINDIPPILCCSNIIKRYQYSNFSITVLDGITMSIEYNKIIAIIGASGSGKSTLLHIMGGLDKPTSGDVFLEGRALNKLSDKDCSIMRNTSIGFIYQFHHLLPDFSVLENIAMPLLIKGLKFAIAKHKAQFILELIGLNNLCDRYPCELSGGESQRVAVARAIINNPPLVLADEPTGNLDESNSNNVFKLLEKINLWYGTTFVIATHDLSLAKKCHKIYIVSNGMLKISTI